MFACPYSRSEMVKEKKNYWTSCPVNRTEFSKFTGQFQILSDNTLPRPLSPHEMFFFHSLNFFQLCVIMEIDCYS